MLGSQYIIAKFTAIVNIVEKNHIRVFFKLMPPFLMVGFSGIIYIIPLSERIIERIMEERK